MGWNSKDNPPTWLAVLGIVATIVACLYAALTYHQPHESAKIPTPNPPQIKPVVDKPGPVDSSGGATSSTQPGDVVKQCSGSKSIVFTPKTPGVMQTGPDGSFIDLGDGGGGTRLQEWKVSWTAPAKIIDVQCATGRNQNRFGPPSKNGSTAECIGSINGGNDAITLTVTWDGPCDQQ